MKGRARALEVLVAVAPAFALTGVAVATTAAPSRIYIQQVTLSSRLGMPHGEPGAMGAVTICLDPSRNTVAYNFTALTLADHPTKGQIRRGAAGTAVVAFGAAGLIDPTVGEVEWNDSSTVTASVASQLAKAPHGFYVTVNTRSFSKGALRGRLGGWKKVSADSDATSECAFG